MRYFAMMSLMASGLAGTSAHAQFTGPIRTAPPAPRSDWNTVTSGSSRPDTYRESRDIRERIRHGQASGQLSRTEARRFRRENGQLRNLASRYGNDGLSESEASELATRAAVLRDQVDLARLGEGPATPKRP